MNRYLIDNQMKMYYKNVNIAQEKHPNSTIIEYNDVNYLSFIDKIVEIADKIGEFLINNTIHEVYSYKNDIGVFDIFLLKDIEDGRYYDYLEYTLHKPHSTLISFLRTMSTPEEFYNKFVVDFRFTLVCASKPGSCKSLSKISDLKGIKQIGGAKLVFSKNKTVSNPVYIKDDNLYIDCRDYFSPIFEKPEDVGTPLNYRLKKYFGKKSNMKFIYDDNWGSIVLRRVAWLKFDNFCRLLSIYNDVELSKLCCDKIVEYHGWNKHIDVVYENMFYNVCKIVRKING